MKKCPPGEYYCNDSKKCKKIPSGYHVGARGYLTKDDDENGKKMVTVTEPMEMATALMVVMVEE